MAPAAQVRPVRRTDGGALQVARQGLGVRVPGSHGCRRDRGSWMVAAAEGHQRLDRRAQREVLRDARLEVSAGNAMISRFLPLFVIVCCSAGGAQSSSRFSRVAWTLADFIVLGDTAYGVQLLASPNLKSEQGRGRHMSTSLSVDPGVAHKWASGVSHIVDSVSNLSRGERKVFETVPLATNLGQGKIF